MIFESEINQKKKSIKSTHLIIRMDYTTAHATAGLIARYINLLPHYIAARAIICDFVLNLCVHSRSGITILVCLLLACPALPNNCQNRWTFWYILSTSLQHELCLYNCFQLNFSSIYFSQSGSIFIFNPNMNSSNNSDVSNWSIQFTEWKWTSTKKPNKEQFS